MIYFIALLFFGYLIGSFSPGYFLGRLVRGIDIREYGNHNTGATNAYRVIGPVYGVITAAFDTLKSSAAYLLAVFAGNIHPDLAILIGLAAVAGHNWPFYLKFRGGKGIASLFGLSITALIFSQSIFVLTLIIGTIFSVLIVSKRIQLEVPVRKIVKFAGLALPLGLIWFPKIIMLWIVGVLFTASLVFDILRINKPELNIKYLSLHGFAKKKEAKRFSGVTFFLFSAFIIFLLFKNDIAAFAMTMFIVGDILAPLGGDVFLPKKLIGEKTVGGLIIMFAASFAAGFFLNMLTPLSLSLTVILFGAGLTAVLDQLAYKIDDNLLVPIGTAMGLAVLGL